MHVATFTESSAQAEEWIHRVPARTMYEQIARAAGARCDFRCHSTEDIRKELEITASNLWVSLHRARLRLAIAMKSRWQLGGAK